MDKVSLFVRHGYETQGPMQVVDGVSFLGRISCATVHSVIASPRDVLQSLGQVDVTAFAVGKTFFAFLALFALMDSLVEQNQELVENTFTVSLAVFGR